MTLYTIELEFHDGRAPLWAMSPPAGWRLPVTLQTAYPERAGLFTAAEAEAFLQRMQARAYAKHRARVRVGQARAEVA